MSVMNQEYVLYGWKGCPFCKKAEDLLIEHNKSYIKIDVDDAFASRDEFFKHVSTLNHGYSRTVPQIFAGGRFVGGYTALATYIEREVRRNTYEAIEELKDNDF